MSPKSERRRTRRVDLAPFFAEPQTNTEFGLTVNEVDVELDDPRLIAVATGELVFERRGRGLAMVVDAREEPNPPATLKVRHSFRAVLREDDGGIVLASLELGPPDHVWPGWDQPDRGISPAALKAVRPAVIVAKILNAIRNRSDYLTRLAELNKDRWMLQGQQGARLGEVVARVEQIDERPKRRGAHGLSTDQLYRQVAALCVSEFNSGRRSGFHRLVQERFDLPAKTAADWIYKARREGWLAPSQPGRIYFAPGPRLTEQEGGTNG